MAHSKDTLGVSVEYGHYGEVRAPLNSLVLYLVEGVVPLLTNFCVELTKHRDSDHTYSTLLTPDITDALKTVGTVISVSGS